MNYLLEGQETERLYFRKVLASDFNDWLPFHQEPLSSQFWNGLPIDPEVACREQFNRAFERYEQGLGGMNALISKNEGVLIGLCGLLVQEVDGDRKLEIGYSILPQYWQQGFAFEAAQKCKQYAFSQRWASHLISIIHIENLPSQKVAKNNDMFLDKTTTCKQNPVHIFRVNLKTS